MRKRSPGTNRSLYSFFRFSLILISGCALAIISTALPHLGKLSASTMVNGAGKPQQRAGSIQSPEAARSTRITESGRQQIAALLAEKEQRTPAQRKIDSQLLQAVREFRGQQMAAGVQLVRAEVNAEDSGDLLVDISATVTDDLLSRIQNLGGAIIHAAAQYGTIRARISLSDVETVAGFRDVSFLQTAVQSYRTGARRSNNDNQQSLNTSSPIPPTAWRASFNDRAEKVRNKLLNYLAHSAAAPMFTGMIDSEGDRTHRADDVRDAFGYSGEGVRIGVLSDSLNSLGRLTTLVANGNLPGPGNPFGNLTPVTVVQDLPINQGSDEGSDMLQIVHDIAPRAQLFFATAVVSEASFAENILALRSTPNNCDIIIDDIGYFDEPAFQDGIVAQAVSSVSADGALYFSAAGNEGSVAKHTAGVWEGDFNDAGSTLTIPGSGKTGTVLNFGTPSSPVEGDPVTTLGQAYTLTWSDPQGASNNDYDLFLMNAALTVVKASSTNVQSGSQDPFEGIISRSAVVGDVLVVLKTNTAAVRAINLNTFGGTLTVATTGQTHGHSAAADAFSVAATPASTAFNSKSPSGPFPNPFSQSNVVENYSSDGPRRIFYSSAGTPITPGNVLFSTNGGLVRNKPDITAADGVSIDSGFPDLQSTLFFGTSAAAPHAGAIAALLKSANPSLTPQQIRTVLMNTALDIESTGFDNVSGAGIIQAFNALQSIQPTPELHLKVSAVNVTEGDFSNHNGSIEPGEGVNLVITLTNPSSATATNVSARLVAPPVSQFTSLESGAVVGQSFASYGTISASNSKANTTTPFTFAIEPRTPCGSQIQLFLLVTFDGIPSPQQLTVTVTTGKPMPEINATLGHPQISPEFTSNTGMQTGMPALDGKKSSCGNNSLNPTMADLTGARAFDQYSFANTGINQCVTVTFESSNGANLYAMAYFIYDPTSPTTGMIGAAGSSGAKQTFSFNVPNLAQFQIVVVETSPGAGIGSSYTLTTSFHACVGGPTCSPFTVSPSPLPPGAIGVPYPPQTLISGGGSGFNTSQVKNAPAGLTFSGNTISGTPTRAGNFLVESDITDAICSFGQVFTPLNIAGPVLTSIIAISGDNQSAAPGTAYRFPLQVSVLDQNNHPMPGISVTFFAGEPFEPSITFPGSNTFITDSNGVATTSIFTANNNPGGVVITAMTQDFLFLSVDFHLTNNCSPIVTNNSDSGPGSLRDAVQNACNNSTVTFAPNVTGIIALTSGEIVITKNLIIQGPGANVLAISGSHKSRIFTIFPSQNGLTPTGVTVAGLTLSDGAPSSTDTSGGGGAVLVRLNTGFALIDSVVANNDVSRSSITSGGGIDVDQGDLSIIRSAVVNNTAGSGGGGGIHLGFSLSVNITDTTIAGNTTGPSGKGGGIEFDTGQISCVGNVSVTDTTIFGNSANIGGNVATSDAPGCVPFKNSIIAGGLLVGSAPSDPDISGVGFVSNGFNLFQRPNPNALAALAPTDITGASPLLLPLGNYGGSTPTMLPQPNSPAIKNGRLVRLADREQRGTFRVGSGNTDIGPVSTVYSLTASGGGSQSTRVLTPFGQPLQATVTESGINISGVTVSFTAPSSGPSALVSGANSFTAITNSGGVAVSPIPSANELPGSYSVAASIGPTLPQVSFGLTNTSPVSSIASTAGISQSIAVGFMYPAAFQAVVRDANNGPLQGFGVTFTAPSSGASGTFPGGNTSVTVTTNSSGIANAPAFTANNTVGNYAVSASVPGAATPASFNLNNLAISLSVKAGSPQTAEIGTVFPNSFQVFVSDSNNVPLNGLSVTFLAPANGASGTFSGGSLSATAATNSNGIATAPAFTANNISGGYSVTANIPGKALPASFGLVNLAVPSVVTATEGTPQSALPGATFSIPFKVTVRDSNNNLLSGINVTFTSPSAGPSGTFAGNVTSAIVVTDFNGVAVAPSFTANNKAGNYTVTASVGGNVPVASYSLTNIDLPSSIVPSAGTPQSTAPGAGFPVVLQATVRDTNSALMPGVSVTFTAPTTGASGTFSGGGSSFTTTTNSSGVATTPLFTANNITGSYVVTADVGNNVPVASFSLSNVTPGPAASISATAGTSQNAGVGLAFGSPLQATVLDGSGIPVNNATVTFTIVPNGSAGAVFPENNISATSTTDVNGRALSPIPTANQSVGSYTVTATVDGVNTAATFDLTNINIVSGDLTGDGQVTVQDLVVLANIIAGNITPSPTQKISGDVFQDGSGQITIQDLVTLANFIAGNIHTLPVVSGPIVNPGGPLPGQPFELVLHRNDFEVRSPAFRAAAF